MIGERSATGTSTAAKTSPRPPRRNSTLPALRALRTQSASPRAETM